MKSTLKTKSKRIFIDTSGWIELLLTGEKYHKQVSAYFLVEVKNGSKFFTSDYVLDEAWTRLLTHQSLSSAQKLKEKTRAAEINKQLLIMTTDETLFEKSWKAFVKFADHKLSFTDATIATIAQDLKIDEILTLDQGFKKVGFTTKPVIS